METRLFCLERLVPARRERRVTFDLPSKIETAADAAKASSAVLTDCAAGNLSPNEAATIKPSRSRCLPGLIDKSELTFGEPKRLRDKAHLNFVASQPCLVCGRQPCDPHHLRFAQPRAMGLKVSDEFTVPLCRGHHRQLNQAGNERPGGKPPDQCPAGPPKTFR